LNAAQVLAPCPWAFGDKHERYWGVNIDTYYQPVSSMKHVTEGKTTQQLELIMFTVIAEEKSSNELLEFAVNCKLNFFEQMILLCSNYWRSHLVYCSS
jgi:hypothetical protein